MKKALVTGGVKRLGGEISSFLTSKGYIVHKHYNSSMNGEISNLKADFTNKDSLKKFLENLESYDVLINNAALFQNDNLDSINHEFLTQHLKVNLEAPVLISSRLTKLNPNIKIINILDAWAKDLPEKFTSYTLSKLALTEATKLMSKHANVFGIELGFTLHKPPYPQEYFDTMHKKYPSTVEDVCKAIEFILDDKFSTGTIIDLTKWKA